MLGRPSELKYVEEPLLQQLEALGWTVLALDDCDKHDPEKSFRTSLAEVIIVKKLKEALKRLNPWLHETQIDDLCGQLQNYTYPTNKLLENNVETFDRIVEGLSADNEETGEANCPVRLIDWFDVEGFKKASSQNEFLAISQYKVRIPGKEEHIIPDVVLFVNGLPLVVVECKAPDIAEPIAEGIEQLLRYQDRRGAATAEGVPELFFYNQFVVSTCYHSARYTGITGDASHFIEWKDPYPFKLSDIKKSGVPSSQEVLAAGMLEPSHLLDIIRNYTVFIEDDEGRTIKIVPRYMQYRGARKIVERLRKDQAGGTLWHTQGSGKSLTMMFVIRKMFNSTDLKDYKIVLLIDRKDLQTQLFKTTKAIKFAVNEAGSIEGLKRLIANTASDVTVAMVHKFGDRGEKVDKFPVLNESNRVLVMIDEAHRSEYSDLAANMWRSMPNSVKVAFTGTPITKTTETFGGYIDAYTMRQAVEDEVVVEIKYEGRATDSEITDHDAMNRAFVDVFGYMETEEQQEILGKYTAKGYLEAWEVIREKASDMLDHYINTVFGNGFKAQVVGVSKEAAHRYKTAIDELLPIKIAELEKSNPQNIDIARLKQVKAACIISTAPNDDPHLKAYGDERENELIVDGFKAPYGGKGKKGGDGNYGIIVVTAMLLTGFDAPIEQVMYLDKVLKNHTLLQAIARVNRTCGADKKCGYVVDYVGVTNHLRDALAEYADADIDETVAVMKNPAQDIDSLNSAYNSILLFIHDKVGVRSIDDTSTIIEELVADDKLRDEFNALFGILSKLFDRVMPHPVALDYRDTFKLLTFIRESVAKLTRDPRLSMKDASKKVRAIIEEYLAVNGVALEIAPVSLLSSDFLDDAKTKAKTDRAVCDEIKYAVREYINVNTPKDPELFMRLSEKLEALLQEFKDNWADLRDALEKFREEIIEGRQREKTYGYEPEHEMPFFALLRQELYGDKDFADLEEDDFEALKDLTNDVLQRFKADAAAVNFWNNESMQNNLRTFIITRLIAPEIKRHVPSVFKKRKEIAQRLLELGFQHFGRDGA
jgi:type I restriction enzyme R subunit